MCKLTGCQRIALEARFLKYTRRLPNGCLIWTGAQSVGGAKAKGKYKSRGGPYGSFRVGRDATGEQFHSRKAHIVWAFLRGIIPSVRVPAGFHLDHTCESGTLCVQCTALVPDKVNLALRHTRDREKDRTQASAIRQEIDAERRAQALREKRRRARVKRRRLTGTPERVVA